MRYCTSCGNAASESDRFCASCGANLHDDPAAQSAEPTRGASRKRGRQRKPDRHVSPTQAAPRAAAAPTGGVHAFSFWTLLIALGWLFYSSGLLGVVAGQYRFDSGTLERAMGNADWISFGLIIGIPIVIRLLRPLLDVVLIPLQFVKFMLPGRVIVGIGLVAPFAVAWLLYDVWGLRNYPFLHASLIFGTLITYAILRTPKRFST